jgi:hypothetical protein
MDIEVRGLNVLDNGRGYHRVAVSARGDQKSNCAPIFNIRPFGMTVDVSQADPYVLF